MPPLDTSVVVEVPLSTLPSRGPASGNIADRQPQIVTPVDPVQHSSEITLPTGCPQTITEHSGGSRPRPLQPDTGFL